MRDLGWVAHFCLTTISYFSKSNLADCLVLPLVAFYGWKHLMKLSNQVHLAYCTNVHRGNSWQETFDSLENYVMKVRERVAPEKRFAIGLRLGADAARELADPKELFQFRKWLEQKNVPSFSADFAPMSVEVWPKHVFERIGFASFLFFFHYSITGSMKCALRPV